MKTIFSSRTLNNTKLTNLSSLCRKYLSYFFYFNQIIRILLVDHFYSDLLDAFRKRDAMMHGQETGNCTFQYDDVRIHKLFFLVFNLFNNISIGFYLCWHRRYMTEILPIQRKTLSNQSIFVYPFKKYRLFKLNPKICYINRCLQIRGVFCFKSYAP